ncbi:MAG: helix-turn-helix transcriptional regulator [Dehalococcoidales bacterium]|nr:helix-turn-helix transcriptional regulator [Dehalococcoidales bacterium]
MKTDETNETYRLYAGFCKTLSDASRLLIINELAGKELSVNELANRVNLHQSNTSKHLAMMRDHGLVIARREGSTVYYRLSDPRLFEAIKLLKAVQADQLEKRRMLTAVKAENEQGRE